MWKNYAWIAVATLVPLGLLIGLLVLAPRDVKTANDEQKNHGILPAQTVSPQNPGRAARIEREKAPDVDMFGKELDGFAKEVVDKRGIAGVVVMAGQPVPGAKVVMRRISRKIADEVRDYGGVAVDPSSRQEWTAETDAEGKFMFYGLEAGHYGLEAYTDTAWGVDDMPVRPNSIPGAWPRKVAYSVGRGHMSIELRPSGPLSGRVLAPEGMPVAGAAVYPIRVLYQNETVALDPIPVVLLSVNTGTDGSFVFPRLVAGEWQLVIRAPGYADQTSDWLSAGEQPVEIRLSTPANAIGAGGQAPGSAAFNISDYRGKHVLLDFWAVWCGPCREEMPTVKAVYEAYRNNPRFVLIGINLDRDVEKAKKYISDNGLNWQHVFPSDWTKTAVLNQYNVKSIPCLILFDPEGKMVARDLRGAAIGEAVRKSLAAPGEPGATDFPQQHGTAQQNGVEVAGPSGLADTADAFTADGRVPEQEYRKAAKVISASLTPSEAGSGAMRGTLDLNIDQDFQFVPEGFPLGLAVGQTEAPPLTDHPTETLSAEPAYHSANVRYGYVTLGNSEDNRFTFVLDDLDKETWIAYFDRNNNEDLTDDGPPIHNEGTGKFAATFQVDVPVVLASGATVQRPYKFWLWSSETNASFYARCHYRAEVNINGTNMTAIAFEQYNHDALYGDAGIWLDLNADNTLDEKTELFKPGSAVTVKGQRFQINLAYP